jgi:peptidoglycan/LPS O-acetylase OafA/YrhL
MKAEIRGLTGLRGIAALTVFLAHTRETLGERGLHLPVSNLVERLFLNGGRQVDIFFVLSGFILAMTYGSWFSGAISRAGYLKFMQRRFARIYPLHFVMLLAVIAMVVAAHVTGANTRLGLGRFEFKTLPEYFLLIHAWNLFGNGVGQWNPPSWSISIEALAYLVFPFWIFLASGWAKTRPWVLVLGAVICGFALNAVIPWGIDGIPGIARGLTEFVLGCAVFNVASSDIANWFKSELGAIAAVLILVVAYALTPDIGFDIGVAAAPLLLTLCANNAVSRALGGRVVFFLGEISYSIYLGHFLFSSISYRVISVDWMRTGPVATVIGIAFILTFVLALSTLTYYTVELPARNFLSGRRRPAPVIAPVGAAGPT